MMPTDHPTLPLHHRHGFSMITAVITIVIMASITAMIMSVTGKTVKATTAQYQKEQAALLARSYTELAVMHAIHYERNAANQCLKTITSRFAKPCETVSAYDVTVNIKYIGNDQLLDQCDATIMADGTIGTADDTTNTSTWASTNNNGFEGTISLVIDVYVEYNSIDDPSTDRMRTFHRRTLQKL